MSDAGHDIICFVSRLLAHGAAQTFHKNWRQMKQRDDALVDLKINAMNVRLRAK